MKIMTMLTLVFALVFSSFASADITITTGLSGLTYNGIYGPNLGGALREQGFKNTIVTSKGSVENLDRIAADPNTIGFAQADVYASWATTKPNEAANVVPIGEIWKECAFIAVRDDGSIKDEDGITAGVKIAIGAVGSGSNGSWKYITSLESDYAKAKTFAMGDMIALSGVKTKVYDAFFWVSAKDRPNKFLSAVLAKGSGLKLVALDDWSMDGKLPNGQPVYTAEKSKIADGFISDDYVKAPCTTTQVFANANGDSEMLNKIAEILMSNLPRITGQDK